MSAYKDGDNDLVTEIDRIQQEINKDLNAVSIERLTEEMVKELDGDTITESKEYFYKETIKNQTDRLRRGRFKRVAAIVATVSILGGGMLGFGVGIGIPFAQRLLSRISGQTDIQGDEQSHGILSLEVPEAKSSEHSSEETDLPSSIWVEIVDRLEPSVVCINTTGTQTMQAFGFSQSYPTAGSASGIVFHEDSERVYIATNCHVVESMDTVTVSISGCDPVPAMLVAKNAETDLSVISFYKSDLKKVGINNVVIAVFGDSDKMQVGDAVLAIGNALGYGNTATLGIVSAKNKKIPVGSNTLIVVQTDAAINSGNSGGPLVNMRGEVIGINTAKVSSTQVEGMGFSITSNVAKPIIEDLMGRMSRPFLGISGYDMTEEIAKIYNLPQLGVFVDTAIEGGSAQAAGIKRTDIITGFNGQPVITFDQLTEEIKKCRVGDTVDVNIIRDGHTFMTIPVKLAEYNGNDKF